MSAFRYNPPVDNLHQVLPRELLDKPIWHLWRAKSRNGKNKPAKVPYYTSGSIRCGELGGADDRNKLVTFEKAWDAYKANPARWAGVGIALLPDYNIGAIDLDNCVSNGTPDQTAHIASILNAAEGCYIEISPSGRGLRIIGRTEGFKPIIQQGLEAYCDKRFVTVTGRVLPASSTELVSIDPAVQVMQQICAHVTPQRRAPSHISLNSKLRSADTPETLENVERVRSALSSLDPDHSYDEWFTVLAALHSTRWNCAEELAREWSRKGSKYDEGAFDRQWSHLKADRGTTLGTLFHMARLAGWQDTAQPSGAINPATLDGDVLSGYLFAEHLRGRWFRVSETRGVYRFDPNDGWRTDPNQDIAERKAAREVANWFPSHAAEVSRGGDTEYAAKLIKLHARTSKLHGLDAMSALGWTYAGMTFSASELDANPELLGVRNGVLDLRSGALRPFSPDELVTRRVGVEYHPEAEAPTFLQFLERVQPDPAIRRLIQQGVGLTLFGQPGVQILFFFHGNGANGKTTFIEALIITLGEYAAIIPAEALMRQPRSSSGPDPATMLLHGARGAFVSEVRAGRLDEERVKLWTGGDKLAARPLYARDFVEFAPSHTLIMSGNHQPAIRDTSDGIWRRICLIGWNVKIPEHEQDPHLPARLRSEGSGILNWCHAGLLDYWRHGLVVPPSVKKATSIYRSDEDTLGQFLDECCHSQPGASCPTESLYARFRMWAEQNGVRPPTKNVFTRSLRERGYEQDAGRRKYVGIGLKDHGQPSGALVAA